MASYVVRCWRIYIVSTKNADFINLAKNTKTISKNRNVYAQQRRQIKLINQAFCVGKITRGPDKSLTKNSFVACHFAITVPRPKVKGKEYPPDVFPCASFGDTANFICKYFRVGMWIAASGRMQLNHLIDTTGLQRNVFCLIVERVTFCSNEKSFSVSKEPEAIESTDDASFSLEEYD